MKGYIIYDEKTGEVKHHGVQSELPQPSSGQKLLEIDPELVGLLASRKAYFVADGAVPFAADFSGVSLFRSGGAQVLECEVETPPMAPSAESSLEAAIRENTGEVRKLSERLEKMFQL